MTDKPMNRLIVAVALTLTSLLTHAIEPQQRDHMRASLLLESTALSSSEKTLAGLYLEPEKNWHSYWLNPGDSGLATTLEWRLPTGVTAGAIQWPQPDAYAIETLVNYGYGKPALLTVPLTVAKTYAGSSVKGSVLAKWLVCNDICIPQQATFDFDWPVTTGENTSKRKPSASAKRFATSKASQPTTLPIPASYTITDKLLMFRAGPIPTALREQLKTPLKKGERARFFVDQRDTVDHAAPQYFMQVGDQLQWEVPANAFFETPDTSLESVTLTSLPDLSGVISVKSNKGKSQNFRLNFLPQAPGSWPAKTAGGNPLIAAGADQLWAQQNGKQRSPNGSGNTANDNNSSINSGINLGLALLFALLGGAVLNLMPCVFPVLSIKLIALAEGNGNTPQSLKETRLHALVYGVGVVLSFVLLAGLLLALRAGGEQLGWGFQLQSPMFVAALVYVLFLLGLSLSGVVSFGQQLMGVGDGLTEKPGLRGPFFTGVLAVVVASPCTAPLMGSALGWAIVQPTAVALLVFAALGLGMALPFILLAWWPRLTRWLPKPGLWMDTFKQAMAFPLYLTAVWLLWVLGQQVGIDGLATVLTGLVVIAFGAWLWGHQLNRSKIKTVLALVAAVTAVVMLTTLSIGSDNDRTDTAANSTTSHGDIPYSKAKLAELLKDGRPVFIDMTASWCITCQVNKRVALTKPAVTSAFAENDVTVMVGDWTNRDPAITEFLESFNRTGVPLYVLFDRSGKPQTLPQILSVDIVLKRIKSL